MGKYINRRQAMKLSLAAAAGVAASSQDLIRPFPASAAVPSDGDYLGNANYPYIDQTDYVSDELGDPNPELHYNVSLWTPVWNPNLIKVRFTSEETVNAEDGQVTTKILLGAFESSSLFDASDEIDLSVVVHGWNHTDGKWTEHDDYNLEEVPLFHSRYLSGRGGGWDPDEGHSDRPDLPEADDFVIPRGSGGDELYGVDRRYDMGDGVSNVFQYRHFRLENSFAFIVLDVRINDEQGWRRFFFRYQDEFDPAYSMLSDINTAINSAEANLQTLPFSTTKTGSLFRALCGSAMNSQSVLTELSMPRRRQYNASHNVAAAGITGRNNFGSWRAANNAIQNLQRLLGNRVGRDPNEPGVGWRAVNLRLINVMSYANVTQLVMDYLRLASLDSADNLEESKSDEGPQPF